jgi:hypothetical protein
VPDGYQGILQPAFPRSVGHAAPPLQQQNRSRQKDLAESARVGAVGFDNALSQTRPNHETVRAVVKHGFPNIPGAIEKP